MTASTTPVTPGYPAPSLHGRCAVVTGAARGIGREIAHILAAAGATVMLSDVDELTLDRTVASLREEGLRVDGVPADVTDPDQIRRVLDRAAATTGQLDIVVANAGRMTTGGLGNTDPQSWEAGIAVNLTGTFLTTKAALPHLRRSSAGRLITITSMAAFDPRSVAGASYSVAKAGVVHLTAIAAIELAGSGATANAIAPGAVETDMSQSFGDDVLAAFAERSPMGRIAQPNDVARVALFLASDLGAFVNGQTIRVSGGP